MRTGRVADNQEVAGNFTLFRMFTWPSLFSQVSYRQEQPPRKTGRLAALVLDRLGRGYRRLRVKVPAARRQRAGRRVELVEQRDPGGNVELGDRRVADPVQVLDQRAQRVAVSHYQDRPAGGQVR